ncbi:23S rRNA (pseudouridine(1915)-N(3))-methyltransferase RlmH [Bradyrhizobium sp. WD16]|uniref:23S rRNA (pseudouridine(1915)-N(3))-methyltransferase RlmH n=1 Tax=Bradyrhizobium sp. WD16 TaxID=1521768 RepID=UPI0020A358CC|nr:23S rRNA (pseudouridine(1915)-N(3))-methyltransferase RlmH [Bradyrhizobium sp. WD16]UTD26895.1 23S rRNA (pseudouridine(1915)-N(3))-methyltransferase RlmH [Bradyrhizobium sp. WD16]
MRIVVIAVGRMKQGPERDLAERYRGRFAELSRRLGFRALDVIELPESKARDTATRMAEEAAAITAAMPEPAALVVLDEGGKALSSGSFAERLGRWRDDQTANLVFVIGGADGLSPELKRKAALAFAFGAATWPHQMVRIMLLEQLYRAATILAGHPYHRS